MTIQAISALKDNYIWAITEGKHCIIVDPGDSQPVLEFLQTNQLTLRAILITHHHWDHCHGVETLIQQFPVPVYASKKENVLHKSQDVQENTVIPFHEFNMNLQVMEIPGHTLGHVAYFNDEFIFCGDTLFAAGCGRVFEGTHEMMYHTLQKIAALSASTKIYCGHEYTINNLKFAKVVEPNNPDIDLALKRANDLRNQSKPTLPTSLQDEKRVNPFLRCDSKEIIHSTEKHAGKKLATPIEVFTVLRKMKDDFVA